MSNLNKIIVSDCFDFMRSTKNESVDLAVLDPPYNMSKGEWDTFKSERDFFDFTFSWIDALLPKIKQGGSLYIFNTPYNCAFILQHLIQQNLEFQNWISWDKRDGIASTKRKFIPNQETILYFSKGTPKTFNADQVRIEYDSPERIAHAIKKGYCKKWTPLVSRSAW